MNTLPNRRMYQRRNRLMPQRLVERAREASSMTPSRAAQPGSELRERESMQAKRRASFQRTRASEIIDRTSPCVEEKHLCAGSELLQKPASLTKANRCGTGLNGHDNRIASPH